MKRFGLLGLLFGLTLPVSAQTPPANDRPLQKVDDQSVYESFFQRVDTMKKLSADPHAIWINGQSVTLQVPKLQDVIGLTDAEMEILNASASDCVARLKSLMEHRPSIFEARLERIESGEISPSLQKELEELDQQHSLAVLDHVQQLRNAFGESRFRILDDFVHSPNLERALMPTTIPRIVKPDRK